MRTKVRERCMIESEVDLVSNTLLNDWINESWQDLRLELSNNDIEFFMTTASGTLTAGVVTGTAHGSMPLPSDAHAIYGLDLVVDGQVIDVDPISFQQRNDGQCGTTKTGVPVGFHITNIGQESTTSVGTGTIILSPAPDIAYAYRLWYLPAWVDITSDTHVFNGIAGCEQWVIWDVCVKVAIRTNDSKNQEAGALRERDRVMARTVRTIKKMNRAGPTRRRDSRAERA
jgi:hypothetical protein